MDLKKAYQILGLREGATEEEIKAAYRALAQKYDPQAHENSPLQEEFSQKMTELNDAFDTLMSYLRSGSPYINTNTNPSHDPAQDQNQQAQYHSIRQMIQAGNVDQAITLLSAIPNGAYDAEWNFLMGSAYYYKGWLAQALQYFRTASRLAPQNAEYAAALRNLQQNMGGAMPGNPYGNAPYGPQTMTCSCCDVCAATMCMNMCCDCGMGGC